MSLGEFAMLLAMVGGLPYIVQIIWGKVRPERATWLVWSLILALAIWSQHSAGATDSIWFLAGDFVVTLTIFLLSLWRGRGGFTRVDMFCVAVAGVSLGLWQWSGVPLFAVWGVLIADVAALAPTLAKSLRDPKSESLYAYSISGTAALFGALAVGRWDLTLLAYPAYIFLADLVLVTTLITGNYHATRARLCRCGDVATETG